MASTANRSAADEARLSDIRVLASELMREHEIGHWTFGFDRATSRLGVCNPRKMSITISTLHALHSPVAQIRDTIIHEIAHALVWEADPGVRHGHDRVWKAMIRSLGGDPQASGSAYIPADAQIAKTPRRVYVATGNNRKRICKAQVGDRLRLPRGGGEGTIVSSGTKNFKCVADDGTAWRISFLNAEIYLIEKKKERVAA